MYSDWVWFLVIFIWLGVLSFYVWKERKFLLKIFPKENERDIRRKFEEVLELSDGFKESIQELDQKFLNLQRDGFKSISRVEFLRYNPYDDTGGNQSFTVVLLDRFGTGVVVTSLHARGGTRIYAKPVKEGKAIGFEFSKEEKEVISKALR